MATKVESQPACHFMRLPIEVREMIYRPLVIAKYVMMEQTMNSEEVCYSIEDFSTEADIANP